MQKRFFLMALCLLLSVSALVAQTPGDVNGDDNIDIIDLLYLTQYLSDLEPQIFSVQAADVNQDGQISLADLICLNIIIFFGSTPFPGTPDTTTGVGQISLSTEPYQPHLSGQEFYAKVFVNTGSQRFGAIDMTLHYDPLIMEYLSVEWAPYMDLKLDLRESGSQPGIRLKGVDLYNFDNSESLHVATLKFKALMPFEEAGMSVSISELIDSSTTTIGIPEGIPKNVRIIDGLFGDVNEDGVVDIIDALIVAQYYVQLCPMNFKFRCGMNFELRIADVNNNNTADIVDALLIAQYYVRMIDHFPIEEYVPEAISE